jgi:hypothetical protein
MWVIRRGDEAVGLRALLTVGYAAAIEAELAPWAAREPLAGPVEARKTKPGQAGDHFAPAAAMAADAPCSARAWNTNAPARATHPNSLRAATRPERSRQRNTFRLVGSRVVAALWRCAWRAGRRGI